MSKRAGFKDGASVDKDGLKYSDWSTQGEPTIHGAFGLGFGVMVLLVVLTLLCLIYLI